MTSMNFRKFVNCLLYMPTTKWFTFKQNFHTIVHCLSLYASRFSHEFRRKVCMSSSAVPVSWHWFGVQRYDDSEVLGYPVKHESRYPKFISHFYSNTWSHLKFPLKNRQVRRCNFWLYTLLFLHSFHFNEILKYLVT